MSSDRKGKTVGWSRAQSATLAGFAIIAFANVLAVWYHPGLHVAESSPFIESRNQGPDEQSHADLTRIRLADPHREEKAANLRAQILSALNSASDPLHMDDNVAAEILSFPGGGIPLPRNRPMAGSLSQLEVDRD